MNGSTGCNKSILCIRWCGKSEILEAGEIDGLVLSRKDQGVCIVRTIECSGYVFGRFDTEIQRLDFGIVPQGCAPCIRERDGIRFTFIETSDNER